MPPGQNYKVAINFHILIITMEATYSALAERVIEKWAEKNALGQKRIIVAVAGPPGSGKTTITNQVAKHISQMPNGPSIKTISADGFHLSRATLKAMPNAAEAFARRGAPWTFNGTAAANLARRLGEAAGRTSVSAPSFDHAIKDPVDDGLAVDPDIQICIFEGNYLLSDEEPWRPIGDLADDRWLVRVDADLARSRLAARHVQAGIETTMEDALRRADANDMVNGAYVMQHSAGRFDVLIDSRQEPWRNS